MALIFLEVLIIFTVLTLNFSKSDCLDFIANDEWPPFTQPQSTDCDVWEQRWSLNISCNGSQKQFPSLKINFS